MTGKPISSKTAIFYLLAGAVLISFSPVFVKIAHVGPTMSGVYRNLFGGLALMIVIIINKDNLWRGYKQFMWAGLCGLVFAVDLTAWHKSVHYIGPGLSTILGNFQAFILAGFGLLVLKEKLSIRFIISIPLAMIGLVMIFGLQWDQLDLQYKIGVILGLVTAVSYAAFTLILRHSRTGNNPLSATVNLFIISIVTAIFMSIFSLLQAESFTIPDKQSWLSLLGYGILCHAAGWILISRALPNIKISLVGLILLLQPTLAFVWDILFFKRPTTGIEYMGAMIALTAIYLGSTSRKNKR